MGRHTPSGYGTIIRDVSFLYPAGKSDPAYPLNYFCISKSCYLCNHACKFYRKFCIMGSRNTLRVYHVSAIFYSSATKLFSFWPSRDRKIDLAVLCGIPASELTIEKDALTSLPPEIPAGIPSTILCQRPDIAQAERTMASLHAQIGVAYASLFPSLSLTGSLGLLSPEWGSLFTWKARLWSMGANVVQTVFDAGRNEANIEVAIAKYQEGLSNYQQQVLVAFKEVEDALASLHELARQASALNDAVIAGQQTTDLTLERYLKGLTNYLEVVDAERALLEAQQIAAQVRGDRYISTVLLIKALGGAWQEGQGTIGT